MGADYTPTMKPYEKVGAFRYWCQTTLPLVYDDSKSYLELLYSVIHYLNSTISDVANMGDNIDALLEAYNQLQKYVNDYFDNLDVSEEINAKLDEMATDGTLTELLSPFIPNLVSAWLAENLTPTTPPIDRTLAIENAAADAKAVGDAIANMAKPFGTVITPAYITAHTEFQNARTIPSNYVYNFNNYTSGSVTGFPSDLGTIFTLVKLNGQGRNVGGFSEYILTGDRSQTRQAYMYYGFDNGSEVRWVELDAQDFYRTSDVEITENWFSENAGKTVIDLPLNRTYHGRLQTNYAAFGIPDGNSFTLTVFSPFESRRSVTTPSTGFTLYLYASYTNTEKKDLYYCFKSTNETVENGNLRWFKVPTIVDVENINPSDVRPFGTVITPAYITAHTEFQNARTIPSNYVYNFNNYTSGSVTGFPSDLGTIFTLVKLNGQGRTVGGFSEYILTGDRSQTRQAYMYYGFDNGSEVRWVELDPVKNANPSDVRPFGEIITPAYITAHTEFQSARTIPSNYVYNFNNYASGSVTGFPSDLGTIFTLVKLNGKGRAVGGFSEYILTGDRSQTRQAYMYYGFDNGSEVRWAELDAQDFYRTSDVEITENWFSENAGKTVIDLPLNRTYHGRLQTNYAAFGIPDGNSFTLTVFSPFESRTSVTTPSTGFTLYLYASYTNTEKKDLYYCFKSTNETVANGRLRWFKFGQGVKKRYLFIGDSYAEGYSHDGRNDGWCSYCAGYMGISADDYVISYLGGSSFAGASKFVNLLGDYGISEFSDIVVCGGYNDNSYTDAEITTAISTFVTRAKAKYPYARIHIGFVAYNKEGNGEGAIAEWQTIRASLTGTVLPAYQKGVQYGAEYLNNVEYWLNEEGLTPSDGYHPSALGNQRIGMAVANALLTGSAPIPYHDALRLGVMS